MAKQIQIPDIGSDEVTVTEVMVKVGDTIDYGSIHHQC